MATYTELALRVGSRVLPVWRGTAKITLALVVGGAAIVSAVFTTVDGGRSSAEQADYWKAGPDCFE